MMLRVPMTPEAEAKWRAELAMADAIIETEEISVDEDTDKYCFSPKVLRERERRKKIAETNPEYHENLKQRYRDYRKNNLAKCKAGQHDWYMRHREELAKKRKAARLLQKSHGAKEITDTRIINGRKGEVNA